jgi:hypothetical protein
MGTDNWPVDFRYISTRLVNEIVQQSEATRGRWSPTLALNLKVVSIGLKKRDIDYRNKYLLCRKATDAVRGRTGTLTDPGEYIRAEFTIQMGYLTVLQGWLERTHVRIAAMFNEGTVAGIGSVLIALFGSESNYTWKRPVDDNDGNIPSDVDGLYGLLNATREPLDPTIAGHYLERDPGHNDYSRADLVVRLLHDRYKDVTAGHLDVLAKVFHCVDDFSCGNSHYDRVLIGSPVWAATPAPSPLISPK